MDRTIDHDMRDTSDLRRAREALRAIRYCECFQYHMDVPHRSDLRYALNLLNGVLYSIGSDEHEEDDE